MLHNQNLNKRYVMLTGFDHKFYILNMTTKSLREVHSSDEFCSSIEIVRSTKTGTLLILVGFENGPVELFMYKKETENHGQKPSEGFKSCGVFLKKNMHSVTNILSDRASKKLYAITQEGDLFVYSLLKKVSPYFTIYFL